jgi:hypothetical protein
VKTIMALFSHVPVIRGLLLRDRLATLDVVAGLAVEVNWRLRVAVVDVSIVPAKVFVPTLPATSVEVMVSV